MTHKKTPIETISSEQVWRNRWYSLRRDAIRLPDGSEGEYTVVERTGAVFVVPQTTDGQIVLIKNYRYTVGDWLWEIPAGSIEQDHSPEQTAHRELLEEVGGIATNIQYVSNFYTMPGVSDELSRVYFAQGVTLGEPDRESTEVMQVHIFTPDEVTDMLTKGIITDGPSALALWMTKSEWSSSC